MDARTHTSNPNGTILERNRKNTDRQQSGKEVLKCRAIKGGIHHNVNNQEKDPDTIRKNVGCM